MRPAILVFVLAGWGCGASGAPIGSACDLDTPCEDGAVCDFTDPEGPTCIVASGDADGDGVINADDLCIHQAGNSPFDEDNDQIGDDCDRCPIARPASERDRDNDDVDSPCDPDPTTDGDQIVVFEGFNSGGVPDNWLATTGWSFVGGEAIATPLDVVNNEVLVAPLPLVSQHVAVLGQYRIDLIDPQATTKRAGIVAVDLRPAGGSDVTCAGNRAGDVDSLLLDTTLNASSDGFMTSLFDSAGLYRVVLKLNNANAGCALVADNETGAAEAGTAGEAVNQAGLTVRGVKARFQYLLVVQRGPVDQN